MCFNLLKAHIPFKLSLVVKVCNLQHYITAREDMLLAMHEEKKRGGAGAGGVSTLRGAPANAAKSVLHMIEDNKLTREEAVVDEALEKIQAVVGDIPPHELFYVVTNRQSRMEHLTVQKEDKETRRDELNEQRLKLEADLSVFKDDALTTGLGSVGDAGVIDVEVGPGGRTMPC